MTTLLPTFLREVGGICFAWLRRPSQFSSLRNTRFRRTKHRVRSRCAPPFAAQRGPRIWSCAFYRGGFRLIPVAMCVARRTQVAAQRLAQWLLESAALGPTGVMRIILGCCLECAGVFCVSVWVKWAGCSLFAGVRGPSALGCGASSGDSFRRGQPGYPL